MAASKFKMHDTRLTYIYMSKLEESLLQCMHYQACDTINVLPSHCNAKEDLVLISLNHCGMVEIGLRASLKGKNQIWLEI
jgi:hypothetical protein